MFKPKNPEGPRYKLVAEMAIKAGHDGLLTYADLEKRLDSSDRQIIYRACDQANKKVLWAEYLSLAVEPGVGYRVLKAEEQTGQAVGYQQKSRRNLANAVAVAQGTDLALITDPGKRDRHMRVTMALVHMARTVDRHEADLSQHRQMIDDLNARVTKMEREKEGG